MNVETLEKANRLNKELTELTDILEKSDTGIQNITELRLNVIHGYGLGTNQIEIVLENDLAYNIYKLFQKRITELKEIKDREFKEFNGGVK